MAQRARLEVGELPREREREAVALLTERFMDDPVWLAIGPGSEGWRRRVLTQFHRGELAVVRGAEGVVLGASRGGRLVGVQLAYEPGEGPPVLGSLAHATPSMAVGGPLVALRAFRVFTALDRLHPREPHVYARLLAADPAVPGIGRVLTKRLIAHARERGVPLFGETMREDNVAFMRSLGFSVKRERDLPGGTALWTFRMEPA